MRCTDRKDERTDVATRSHGTSANPSGETWRGAHPLVWISVIGFLIAFVWEMLQLPFYEAGGLTPAQMEMIDAISSSDDEDDAVRVALPQPEEMGRDGRLPELQFAAL